ncbi:MULTISPECIES: hypothetical protein [Sphingobium]|nr:MULTISPECIES: hypothetical protein [Sphingobium]
MTKDERPTKTFVAVRNRNEGGNEGDKRIGGPAEARTCPHDVPF